MSHMTSCILRSVKNITVKSKDSLPFVSIIKIVVVQNEPLTNYSKTVLDRSPKRVCEELQVISEPDW